MKALFLLLLIPYVQQSRFSVAATMPASNRPGCRTQDTQSKEKQPKDIRCGQILVRGCDQLTEPEFCRLLQTESDNPLNPSSRDAAQASVINEYNRRGFLDAAISWSDVKDATAQQLPAVILAIQEGRRYTLRRLEFIGNEETPDRLIRRRVALDEGSGFDDDLLDLSIKRINQLGVFEEFTRDDVGMKVNKKEHFVDLTFRLTER
ncbi:MAG: POTRA domain-containing protein [Blastocatellia bacterium]